MHGHRRTTRTDFASDAGVVDMGYHYGGCLEVDIWMPSRHFSPGDACACKIIAFNPQATTHTNLPLFVILEIYGVFYFWPDYSEFGYQRIDALLPGQMEIEVLPEFAWPDGAGEVQGIRWLAALTDPEITHLMTGLAVWEFSWSQ